MFKSLLVKIGKFNGNRNSGNSYTRVILTEIYHLSGMKSFRDDLIDRMKTGWGRSVLASKISHLFVTFKSNILRQENSKNEKRRYSSKNFCDLPLHTRNNDAISPWNQYCFYFIKKLNSFLLTTISLSATHLAGSQRTVMNTR